MSLWAAARIAIGVFILILIVHCVRSFQKSGAGKFDWSVKLLMVLIFVEMVVLTVYAHFFM